MMKQRYKILIYGTYFFLSLFFLSCTSTKKMKVTNTTDLKTSYIIDQLESNQMGFNTLDAKFNLNIDIEGEKQKVKGSLRIKKDSAIWISIAPVMGIEMARIIILPDSIKMFDRINKTYFVSDFSFINNRIHTKVDYYILQSIFLGEDFSQFENENWNASLDGNLYKLYMSNRKKKSRFRKTTGLNVIPMHKIWLNKTFNIKKMYVEGGVEYEEVRSLTVNYKKFKNINQQHVIPSQIEMQIKSNTSDGAFRLKYSKLKLNKKVSFSFKIPKGYTKQ
ncbi:MAG: hypothetical protein CSA94_00090 [Bacteroidetes bacterium]|nr:MAG: hypothetical protein CSA94_00090 [Bacteroidota bacterium]